MTRTTIPGLAAGVMAGLALAFPAAAAPLAARELLAACSGDAAGRAICDGYLMAVTDAAKIREDRGRNARVCAPDALNVEQVRLDLLDFAGHPSAARDPQGQAQGQGDDQGRGRRRHRNDRAGRDDPPAQDSRPDLLQGNGGVPGGSDLRGQTALRLIAAMLRVKYPCQNDGQAGGRDRGQDMGRDGGRDGRRDRNGGGARNP